MISGSGAAAGWLEFCVITSQGVLPTQPMRSPSLWVASSLLVLCKYIKITICYLMFAYLEETKNLPYIVSIFLSIDIQGIEREFDTKYYSIFSMD